ncbi:MAG: hypothetical protein KDB14_18135 [Planctomycetales bacterium]|nr:hypothetical protein [Planctomycetales bacterium]
MAMICEAPPAPMGHVTHELATTAWLAANGVDAGWLVFQDGVLRFVDHNGNLVFDSPVSEIERVDFPWYHWGAVCRIRLLGETFSLRFNPPFGGALAMRMQGLSPLAVRALSRGSGSADARIVAQAWRMLLKGH